jgi:serine/threonine-protein kinase
MPFADPDFNTGLLARTLAQRGHVGEAWRVAGSRDADLYAELAWLGGVPAGDARTVFGRWEAEGAPAARGALPWWAGQRDTATLSRFSRRRAASGARAAEDTTGSARIERDRAVYDVAAVRAWLALANGDTATATALFLAVPDSLCPTCFLHRLPRAELLLRANRADEARALVGMELTAIVGGPHPIDTWWQLARAEAAEHTGDVAAAAAGYARVLDVWHNADPTLQPYLERARAGLARTARSPATEARR